MCIMCKMKGVIISLYIFYITYYLWVLVLFSLGLGGNIFLLPFYYLITFKKALRLDFQLLE